VEQNSSLQTPLSKQTPHELQKTRESLLNNKHCDPTHLLRAYQEILLQREVAFDHSEEQSELLRLGVVVSNNNQLKVANQIDPVLLNPSWIDSELIRLDPYSKIRLKLLKLDEKASLPYRALTELLSWTGNQPFLVQKLSQILQESKLFILSGQEPERIQALVQKHIIENWETQAASVHLKEIRNGLLNNQRCDPFDLLRRYQQILQQVKRAAEESWEETELINLGLVTKKEGQLKVANRIYQAVFNPLWVEEALYQIRHSSQSVTPPVVEEPPILSTATAQVDQDPHKRGKRKGKWLIFALVLLGTGLLSFRLISQSRHPKIFREANELYIQGNYEEAVAKYNQVLNTNANYYQAWANRGYAFAGLREYEKMLESCTSATVIQEQAVYAWNCQGEAFYNLKQYDNAIAAFNQAIALEPNNPLFQLNKADALLANQETDQALEVINQGISLLKSTQDIKEQDKMHKLAVAFTHRGKAFWQKQEYEKALQAYSKALTYVPDYFSAQRDRGIVLQKLKRSEQAVANFKQMLTNQQLSAAQKAEIWFYQGLSLVNLSRHQAAITAFDQALQLKPDYQAAAEAKKRIDY
jgi:tetratricopeptide (TPR) repeat protein